MPSLFDNLPHICKNSKALTEKEIYLFLSLGYNDEKGADAHEWMEALENH